MEQQKRSGMEDYALVLDFMPVGKSTDTRKEAVAQVIGTQYFTLLELYTKENIQLNVEEKIFIGKDERDKVNHIKGRIDYDALTGAARSELKTAIKSIIKEREADFVNFINKCGAVTMRLHQLELLPGIGKKHMQEILKAREERLFENFEDVRRRVHLLPNPEEILAQRIEAELQGTEKYYVLTKPPARPREY